MKRNYLENPGLLETLASIQHEIWSHWMSYLFSVATRNEDGSFTIPEEKASRWRRQMSTSYSELTEMEKNSDRGQALKIISLLKLI